MPHIQLDNGGRVEIILPLRQAQRLVGTCFRGPRCRQAGNFFKWRDFSAFIHDPTTQGLLKPELERLVREAYIQSKHRIELGFDEYVGWDSVAHVDDLKSEDIALGKVQRLNRRATALFLPDGLILAPQTKFVTMVLSQEHIGHWRFIIWTMYPGLDVGDLLGDMTELYGFVWLPWSNPGDESGDE